MIDAKRERAAPYPEASLDSEAWLERHATNLFGRVWHDRKLRLHALKRIVPAVAAHEPALRRASADDILAEAGTLRQQLVRTRLGDVPVARCFALVREAARRTLGMRHHDVQLVGGLALVRGVVAEMETGEGKTLTATLAAATAALAGWPVHVVTVNDYLAQRDAREMEPLYRALGLRVGCVVHGMDREARRAAYASDITYCANKQITFDYLRDRIVLGRERSRTRLLVERLYRPDARLDMVVLRGLYFAIVDEADSVLIDEARTPLLISETRPAMEDGNVWSEALSIAAALGPTDYSLNHVERRAVLTPSGEVALQKLCSGRDGVWRGPNRARELVLKALSALYLYKRDEHYVVVDGAVTIVDEYTGRLMPDRSWEGGLHQLIEAKEGVQISGSRETLARMSYQRFFRRYLHLSGMTGTAAEVAGELWNVYRLSVVRIPTNRPVRRRMLPSCVVPDEPEKWRTVVRRTRELQKRGRPVLIGTRSIADSLEVSRLLHAAGIEHRVLNGIQDADEARIVREAGQPAVVTVATNMAGRGTDIKLGPGVAELGGLHVFCTQPHDSKRIDRQLFGRCARQGDPGSCEAIWSLDDELPLVYLPEGLRQLWKSVLRRKASRFRQTIALWLIRLAQRRAQVRHSVVRRQLMNVDDKLDAALAFAGPAE